MVNTQHDGHMQPASRKSLRQSWRIPALMLLVIAGFYLLREHWGHLAGYWVYLLLLACPLMHLMHGHGNHGGHEHPDGPAANTPSPPSPD